jgi:uroporphyrin-III C-methyltransferase
MENFSAPSGHLLCECPTSNVATLAWSIFLLLCGSTLTLLLQCWKDTPKPSPGGNHWFSARERIGTTTKAINGLDSVLVDVDVQSERIIELASQVQKANAAWSSPPDRGASIELIGTGPGDPQLLTVYAVQAIRNADYVLADLLTPPAILNLVKCDVHIAGKTKGNAESSQNELNRLGLEALRKGLKVVRLKNGDPFMYGRGGEEVLFFRRHGFEAKVIPGISSSLSASMAAGIPVTHRSVANELCIATGQLKEGSNAPAFPEYRQKRTTVLLMAVSRLPAMSVELQKQGYPEDLPIAIIENAWRPDQRVTKANVSTISMIAKHRSIASPATIVIGNVVAALD